MSKAIFLAMESEHADRLDGRYKQLVDEATDKHTSLQRRLQIRRELSIIRKQKKNMRSDMTMTTTTAKCFEAPTIITIYHNFIIDAHDIEEAAAAFPVESEVSEIYMVVNGRKVKLSVEGLSFKTLRIEESEQE